MYIEPSRLVELIRDAKKTKVVSSELAIVVLKIAEGILNRKRWWLDREDYKQNCFINFLLNYKRIKLRDDPFSYITASCVSVAQQMIKGRYREFRLIERLKRNQG